MIKHWQNKIRVIDKDLYNLRRCGKSRGANVTYVTVVRGLYGAATRPDSAYLIHIQSPHNAIESWRNLDPWIYVQSDLTDIEGSNSTDRGLGTLICNIDRSRPWAWPETSAWGKMATQNLAQSEDHTMEHPKACILIARSSVISGACQGPCVRRCVK